jgi:hypothetical protein
VLALVSWSSSFPPDANRKPQTAKRKPQQPTTTTTTTTTTFSNTQTHKLPQTTERHHRITDHRPPVYSTHITPPLLSYITSWLLIGSNTTYPLFTTEIKDKTASEIFWSQISC